MTSLPSIPPAQDASMPFPPISDEGVTAYGGLKHKTSTQRCKRGRRPDTRDVCTVSMATPFLRPVVTVANAACGFISVVIMTAG